MDVNRLKEVLYSVCEQFFCGTNIVWAKEISESPPLPLITLRMDSLNKAIFPFDEGFENDRLVEYYNASIMLEIKGYTNGYVGNTEVGTIQTAENTAMNDLQQFANYAASIGLIEQLAKDNVSMTQEGPVRDTTIVKAGSRHEYSAMVEYKVDFVLAVSGVYAVSPISEVETETGGNTGNENDGSTESSRTSCLDKNTFVKAKEAIPEHMTEELGYFDTVSKIEGEFQ